MDLDSILPILLAIAWLLPLASFVLILFLGPRMGKAGHCAGYLATGAIMVAFLLSASAMVCWQIEHPALGSAHGSSHDAEHGEDAEDAQHGAHAESHEKPAIAKDFYTLGQFGSLKVTIGVYIDALTLAMFCMVTLVASCIHVYSIGYMHEELEDVTDPLVVDDDGRPLVRPGRFPRFFQYLSLFCFSMLGLVIAGNIAMVFVFWELVGICSYLLIGFYIERKSASNAANKAFIVNRVGDFGMIIGLMVLWSGLGTFHFERPDNADESDPPGIFEQVRTAENDHQLAVPDAMVRMGAKSEIQAIYADASDDAAAEVEIAARMDDWREQGFGYELLIVAGLGIFCGCMGKSAQFPLHVWLPDAMEGPTPVSALIHAATMVAAGVYLVGRFYPVFTPEVLLVIAFVGAATLFIAATIAITATDIKRVLAYSTVSQLGYMMFALGLGGWAAGLFHLFTHAFFKSLLFLCSGSVIHACHTNEMTEMGGLRKKMPWTAYTMLVGCLAISGAGIPLVIGLSGYYSKDSILAQAFSFGRETPQFGWLFFVAAAGAAITAFYMFRLWFMTFAGEPKDEHIYEHAHESPKSMYVPLVVLAVFAVIAGWNFPLLGLPNLLDQAQPPGVGEEVAGRWIDVTMPAEHVSHEPGIHNPVSWIAFGTAGFGFLLALVFYGIKRLNPETVRRRLAPLHWFLLRKWLFVELYYFIFILPAMGISKLAAWFDEKVIDGAVHKSVDTVQAVSQANDYVDQNWLDSLLDGIAAFTYEVGQRLRPLQSGNLRQYVLMIAVGTIALIVLASLCLDTMGFGL